MKRLPFALVLAAAAALLAAAYYGAGRLQKRADLRRELAPIMRIDLIEAEDFVNFEQHSSKASLGELFQVAAEQVKARNERIRKLRLIDPNPYVEMLELLVDLMRKENEFVRSKNSLYRTLVTATSELQSIPLQVKFLVMRVQMTGDLASFSGRHRTKRDLRRVFDDAMELVKKLEDSLISLRESYEACEVSRKEATQAWDAAYGWIRWLGVSIAPTNLYRAYRPRGISPEFIEEMEQIQQEARQNTQEVKRIIDSL